MASIEGTQWSWLESKTWAELENYTWGEIEERITASETPQFIIPALSDNNVQYLNTNFAELEQAIRTLINEFRGKNIDVGGFIKPGMWFFLPPAGETYRGKIITIKAKSGSEDKIYICRKKTDETYEWKEL